MDMPKRYFVYILANRRRGVLYVGLTSQLINRLTAHRGKLAPGFTAKYGVTMLVYFEEHASVVEARAREAAVKRWRRDWKFALIEKINPEWRDLTSDLGL
jgi:putative endonuclease